MEPNNATNVNQSSGGQSPTQMQDDGLMQQLVERFISTGLSEEQAVARAHEVLGNPDGEENTTRSQSKADEEVEAKENKLIADQIIQRALERKMIMPNLELTAREVLSHAFIDSKGLDVRGRTQNALESLNRYVELSKRSAERRAKQDDAIWNNASNPFASLQKPIEKGDATTQAKEAVSAPPTQPVSVADAGTAEMKPIHDQVKKAVASVASEMEQKLAAAAPPTVATSTTTPPPVPAQPQEPVKKAEATETPITTPEPVEEVVPPTIANVVIHPIQPKPAPTPAQPVKTAQVATPFVVQTTPKQSPAQAVPPNDTAQEINTMKAKVVNISSKDNEFFAKYVSEQVDVVMSVISHNEQLPPDMVAGIKETLVKSAKTISNEAGASVSDRIQKLDMLFTQYKNEYATGGVTDHIPTEDTINAILALAKTEVNTGNEENDNRFKETLYNALHNKVRQMKDMEVAVSDIHVALKEEYEKIKKFYLMSSG